MIRNERDIKIFNYDEYEKVLDKKVKVSELKHTCKYYKLKSSGNKNELMKRLYNYLYKSFYVINIQKYIKKLLVDKWKEYSGIAIFNRKLCVNNSDFANLDELDEISPNQFFSFKCIDGQIYGQDVFSLYNLLNKTIDDNNRKKSTNMNDKMNNNIVLLNPYTRKEIPNDVLFKMKKKIELSKILNIKLELEENSEENKILNTLNSEETLIRNKIVDIFSEIDTYGHYTHIEWFLSLNEIKLRNFILKLVDIFNYRSRLSNNIKKRMIPPNGLLVSINPRISFFIMNSKENIQKYAIDLIEKLVLKPLNYEDRSLGCYFVLMALTLVNEDAALAMPWLYESVLDNN